MKKLCGIILTCLFLIASLPYTVMAAQSPDFEQEFTQYLSDSSVDRGQEVAKEDVEASLDLYGYTLADFDTVQEMKDFLGEVIKTDLSNLITIYEDYGLTQESLIQLLADNGETMGDYVYLYDLDSAVDFYTSSDDTTSETSGMDEAINQLLPVILEKIDISDAEITQLINHFTSIEDYLNSSEVQAKYEDLNVRMINLLTASISGEKTEEEIAAEMASIYDEFLPLMKLKAVITLKMDGKETVLPFTELFGMQELEDDATVNVALYNTDSQFLADFKVSNDMFETGVDAGEQIEDVTKEVIKTVENTSKNSATTVKGAKLPKTASNHITYASFGLTAILAGAFMYRKVRNVKGEIQK